MRGYLRTPARLSGMLPDSRPPPISISSSPAPLSSPPASARATAERPGRSSCHFQGRGTGNIAGKSPMTTTTALRRPLAVAAARKQSIGELADVWDLLAEDDTVCPEEGGRDKGSVLDAVVEVEVEVEVEVKASKAPRGGKAAGGRKGRDGGGGGGEQGRIAGAKITKPGRKGAKDTKEAVEKLKKNREAEMETVVVLDVDEPLGLEKVAPRRRDWTPPPPPPTEVRSRTTTTVPVQVPVMDNGVGKMGLDLDQEASAGTLLHDLLGSFGYASNASANSSKQPQPLLQAIPPLKKRKLNLVESAVPAKPLATATKKDKAPKKKARTITELATSEYRLSDDVPARSESLMASFISHQSRTSGSGDMDAEPEVSKRRTKSSRSKVATRVKSRLLTPERALRAAESQELLFGTSSQLVREDSPSFIRDLQHALKESEASATASQQESEDGKAGGHSAGIGLWAVATRNVDGSLLEAETIDLTRTPGLISHRGSVVGAGAIHPTGPLLAPDRLALTAETSMAEDGPTLDEPEAPPPPTLPIANTPALDLDPDLEASVISLPRSMAEAACRARPRSKSPVKKATSKTMAKKADDDANGDPSSAVKPKPKRATKPKAKDKADFNDWTVAELTKQIKDYGFKAVKGKAAMVALLEKCRESTGERARAGTAAAKEAVNEKSPHFDDGEELEVGGKTKGKGKGKASKVSEQPGDGDVAVAPKKRGRPRKNAAADTAVQTPETNTGPASTSAHPPILPPSDKISSSTAPANILVPASPPTPHSRPRASKPTSNPKSKDISKDKSPSDPHPTDPDAALLSAISRAMTAFPPTHDPKNFTWFEKILMYDPVVLEDLTVWLNTVGLDAVGVDEEVWPGLVRTWCEGRGVCCLWRENLKGGKRARY